MIPLREACFAPTGATVSVDILFLSYLRFRSGKTQRFSIFELNDIVRSSFSVGIP